jgi:hypothetical protein
MAATLIAHELDVGINSPTCRWPQIVLAGSWGTRTLQGHQLIVLLEMRTCDLLASNGLQPIELEWLPRHMYMYVVSSFFEPQPCTLHVRGLACIQSISIHRPTWVLTHIPVNLLLW